MSKPKLLSWHKDPSRSHSCFTVLVPIFKPPPLCPLSLRKENLLIGLEKTYSFFKTLPGFAALTLTAGQKGWERWQDMTHPGVGVTVATAPLSLMADKCPAEGSTSRSFFAAHRNTAPNFVSPPRTFSDITAPAPGNDVWASPRGEGPRWTYTAITCSKLPPYIPSLPFS